MIPGQLQLDITLAMWMVSNLQYQRPEWTNYQNELLREKFPPMALLSKEEVLLQHLLLYELLLLLTNELILLLLGGLMPV